MSNLQEKAKYEFVSLQNLGSRDVGREVEQKREAARARFAKQKADNEIEAAVIRAFLQPDGHFQWRVGTLKTILHMKFLQKKL